MKNLKDFILEEFETFRVKQLEVPYNVRYNDNDYIIFKVPDIYSEDDFQIYIQDLYLKDLPGSEDFTEDFFGKNAQNIYDVLFEYEKYEKGNEFEDEDFIDFDKKYDNKINEETNFTYVKVENLKYIIKFEEFDLKEESVEDIKEALIKIFKACETNDGNKWPLDIILDEDNIEYK